MTNAPLIPDDLPFAEPVAWRIPETCPCCGAPMWSDGEDEFCENVDVCGYGRLSVEAPLGSQNDDPDAAFDGAGVG